MGVALGHSDVGVAEHFHDDADVHAHVDEEGPRRVTAVVDAYVADAGLLEDLLPLLPVVARVDGPPVQPGKTRS
ncbi:hypothetical protein Pth03_73900 [Planotetraspora thailandica]|uniref:Uncharacterized protein n=1 Tax=Planotetraspora thailandica TaxID=487172 RepID=A0A8J3Y1E8_9ACTN|nr:hypothetical protein [Planotetraspora thailandica]GII59001.1 hypothetical protein Pth03_73900 [Planotetraspora thailandica]